jgi:hypothetical protein
MGVAFSSRKFLRLGQALPIITRTLRGFIQGDKAMQYPGTHRIGLAGVVIALLMVAQPAAGQVIISEIMYNPASNEKAPNDVEWLEIYNPTEKQIEIAGWYLQDEDGRTEAIAADTAIAAKQAIVLIPGEQTLEDFRAAWPQATGLVIPLNKWNGRGGLSGLSNNPSYKNEVLQLRAGEAESAVIDEVNFDDGDPWPADNPQGLSIYLKPGKLTVKDNDSGENWTTSARYIDHAVHSVMTADFDAIEVGSPGKVAEKSIDATPKPEPAPEPQPVDASEPEESEESDEPAETQPPTE